MEIIKGINNLPNHTQACVLTIGNFDGVHIGHQALLHAVRAKADELKVPSVVITFSPHPAAVLRPELGIQPIFSREDLAEQCQKLGIQILVIQEFTKNLATLSADDFLKNFLFSKIKAKAIFVGYDFSFGKNRSGTFQTLKDFFADQNVFCEQIRPVTLNGQIVSSTLIRKMLHEGDVIGAKECLGRPFSVSGNVVHGDGRGAKIGFPTMNISTASGKIHLKNGVYLTQVHVGGRIWDAISNLGTRPTFSNQIESILETHVLNSHENFYDKNVKIDFLNRVRDELKFSSAEELIKQIQTDVAFALKYFKH